MTTTHGGWEGSEVTEYDFLRLCRSRKMPLDLEFRVPGDEVVPAQRDGERVIFTTHFPCGFTLLVSAFFHKFLIHFGLQPHQLGPNA